MKRFVTSLVFVVTLMSVCWVGSVFSAASKADQFVVKSIRLGMNLQEVAQVHPGIRQNNPPREYGWGLVIHPFFSTESEGLLGDSEHCNFIFRKTNEHLKLLWFDSFQKINGDLDAVTFNADLRKNLVERYGKPTKEWTESSPGRDFGVAAYTNVVTAFCWG